MIIDVVDVACLVVLESKNDSQIPAYRHRPETGEWASQPMKAKTRKRYVLKLNRRVQDAEDQPESLFVLRPDACIASGFEELAQPLMGETANHEKLL